MVVRGSFQLFQFLPFSDFLNLIQHELERVSWLLVGHAGGQILSINLKTENNPYTPLLHRDELHPLVHMHDWRFFDRNTQDRQSQTLLCIHNGRRNCEAEPLGAIYCSEALRLLWLPERLQQCGVFPGISRLLCRGLLCSGPSTAGRL